MRIGYFIQGMILLIPLLFVSCNDIKHLSNENKSRIICSISKFESDNLSRTNINPNNNFSITWASEDIIGIFPLEGYQEPFEIPASQANSSSATFDGGYWDVKNGLQYNAYYPFDKKNFDSAEMKERIPVSYIGQKQNGTSCDIGAFDYTYSTWTTASNGSVYFEFDHIGAIAVFSLKYPATTTYKTFTLSVDESVIPLTGTYDLTNAKVKDDANSEDKVAFVADESSKSTSISLELTNCSGVAGEMGVFYMMLPPMDLSNNEVTLSLTSSAGTTCTYSIEKVMNVKRGKLYKRTGVPKESGVEGTINGWMEEDEENPDSGDTGNNDQEEVIEKNIVVTNSGTLSSFITSEEKTTITSLKITGPLNQDDITFINQMIKTGDFITTDGDGGSLNSLDLSEATIVTHNDFIALTSNTLVSLSLPNGLIAINLYCTELTSVNIPSTAIVVSLTCESLESIDLPNGNMQEIRLSGCKSLKSIVLPYAPFISLANCTSLTSINVPDGIEIVRKYNSGESWNGVGFIDLSNCNSLTTVVLPNSIKSIDDNAFYECTSLENILLPDGVESIGDNAFYKCSSLSTINLPNSITKIGTGAFMSTALSSIVMPNNLQEMGMAVFVGCTSLTSVTFSPCDGIVPSNTFTGCRSLTSIVLPEGIHTVGGDAFSGCTSLASVTLPSSMSTLEAMAFGNCQSIKEIYCSAIVPPTIKENTFLTVSSNCTIYVPKNSVQAYQETDYWKFFSDIRAVDN